MTRAQSYGLLLWYFDGTFYGAFINFSVLFGAWQTWNFFNSLFVFHRINNNIQVSIQHNHNHNHNNNFRGKWQEKHAGTALKKMIF